MSAAIESPDGAQPVASVTPGSAAAEADLREYNQRLIDAWKALDRLEAEGLPVLATRKTLGKRLEYGLGLALSGVLDGWDDEPVAVVDGPTSTSVATHAPAPVSEGDDD